MLRLFEMFCLLFILDAKNLRVDTARSARSKHQHLRIHNGYNVPPGEYSFVVILSIINYYQVFRLCTGSMITEYWGLTAAHCKEQTVQLQAWHGNFTESPLETKMYSQVQQMITHPSYRLLTTEKGTEDLLVNNDICLFRVFTKINIKTYGRLSSIDPATMIGLPVTYIGGGITGMTIIIYDIFRPLQMGEGAIITCSPQMRSISKYIICIAPQCSTRLQRPWFGDSGGPLICDGKIIGICSYGIKSDEIATSGYAPISPYIEWIYDVMHSKNKE